ncbi:MAG: phage holin family protein [Clostridia bacterium]|nr:phage holin family protein [Clostridia bacterium]
MINIIQGMSNNIIIKIVFVVIMFDIFLGSLRAIKEKKWNSTVGINGILRKIGMIGSMLFLFICDRMLNLNLLFMVPEEVLKYINISIVGSCELFGIMFILYETTSILKNMILCDIPAPEKLKEKIEKLLSGMTTELENKK